MAKLPITDSMLHSTDDSLTIVEDTVMHSKLAAVTELDDKSERNSDDVPMDRQAQAGQAIWEEDDEGCTEEKVRSGLRYRNYGVPEIDVESFVSYLLPPLDSKIDVHDVLSSMQRGGLITSGGELKHSGASPAEKSGNRDGAFAILGDVFERSCHHASNAVGREPTFVFILPSTRPLRCEEDGFSEPSGYFTLKEAENRSWSTTDRKNKLRWWYDIGLTIECTKGCRFEDLDDSVSQVIFNMQRTMILDPCRRFTFGITVGNAGMRLWFVSRSTAVVSKVFDFTKEVDLLTRVLLSFSFSSKEELGWDPTIRPFTGSNGVRQYRIDVGEETFETVELLSDLAVDSLISRGTRVWKVKRPDSDEPCVLKDVWLEGRRELEHITYDLILRDVEAKYGTKIRKEVASHLMTPIAHCLVTVKDEEDHTTRVIMRGYKPETKHVFQFRVNYQNEIGAETDVQYTTPIYGSGPKAITRDLRAPFPRYARRRKIFGKRHYRIVFKEVATPLYTVRRLSDVFVVLGDGAKVLEWIHGCGWVHRDISIGNLYLHDGRGLLGDLEYAKRRNVDLHYEGRVGTADFMAVETVTRVFSHPPKPTGDELKTMLLAYRTGDGRKSTRLRPQRYTPPFFHNDLHDLESLWWVGIWILFFNIDKSECRKREKDWHLQWKSAVSGLFPASEETWVREEFLRDTWTYEERTACLSDRLQKVTAVFNALRATLVLKYLDFEAKFPAIRVEMLQETHTSFQKYLRIGQDSSSDIELIPYAGEAPPQTDTMSRLCEECVRTSSDSHAACHVSQESVSDFEADDLSMLLMPLWRVARYELEVC